METRIIKVRIIKAIMWASIIVVESRAFYGTLIVVYLVVVKVAVVCEHGQQTIMSLGEVKLKVSRVWACIGISVAKMVVKAVEEVVILTSSNPLSK